MSESIRKGTFIAIFGPDGSGKSTVLNELKNNIRDQERFKISNYHWRPGILPYKKKINSNNDSFSLPHNTKSKSILISLLTLIYIYIDFLLGYLIFIYPKLRSGNIVYYERYFYDILIDEKRYGSNTPFKLRLFFAKLIPRPSIIVLLTAQPLTIYSRKKELSINTIEKQLLDMKKILPNFQKVIEINVGLLSPSEVVVQIKKKILDV